MWIVSWRFNGKVYIEEYFSYMEASDRAIELHLMRPSIHYSEEKNEIVH